MFGFFGQKGRQVPLSGAHLHDGIVPAWGYAGDDLIQDSRILEEMLAQCVTTALFHALEEKAEPRLGIILCGRGRREVF